MIRAELAEAVGDILESGASPEETAAAEANERPGAVWDQLIELGFSHAPLPEEQGGGGLGFVDASSLLLACGRHAAYVPIAETAFLGGWLLTSVGFDVPAGSITSGPVHLGQELVARRDGEHWVLEGRAEIPWAAESTVIALLAKSESGYVLAAVEPGLVSVVPGVNLGGEPREYVDFGEVRLQPNRVVAVGDDLVRAYWRRGALTRVVAALGAMESTLRLTLRYASEREQFGRAISSFQAIAQHLAVMAREVELSRAVAELAITRTSHGSTDDNLVEVASARVRVCAASAEVSRLAHQVHGAIGVTSEYALQLFTRRLWAWRDEFGDETYWAEQLGRLATDADEGLWPLLTSRPGVHTVGAL